jgi:hypothetical protein
MNGGCVRLRRATTAPAIATTAGAVARSDEIDPAQAARSAHLHGTAYRRRCATTRTTGGHGGDDVIY